MLLDPFGQKLRRVRGALQKHIYSVTTVLHPAQQSYYCFPTQGFLTDLAWKLKPDLLFLTRQEKNLSNKNVVWELCNDFKRREIWSSSMSRKAVLSWLSSNRCVSHFKVYYLPVFLFFFYPLFHLENTIVKCLFHSFQLISDNCTFLLMSY